MKIQGEAHFGEVEGEVRDLYFVACHRFSWGVLRFGDVVYVMDYVVGLVAWEDCVDNFRRLGFSEGLQKDVVESFGYCG